MIRNQIMSTALDLFSQYGIKKVSMNDIARSLHISKRTLYQHFEDKEELLSDGLAYQDEQLKNLWKELEKGPYTVLDTILLFFREIMKRPKWYSRKFYEELELFPTVSEKRRIQAKALEDNLLKLLKRGVDEGVFESNVNFGIVVKLARKQIQRYYPSKSFADFSNVEVYETILFAFLRGICTEEGRKILDRWFVSKQLYNIH
ncbi:AcrR family transcriptional regulator [Parabacteroides sp. PF5-5]|uniref:TetR/AcrR family transcriptional regulator n=1 Tax=unclassified Parabacteroides TaxID=2649774 RepID=UPI002475EEEE|nr:MULTISPECIES: TetR/AcrR family transcriptional regulator [unclassified Parabacteroides]MDH6304877.1 AcrR family transcriptional regulator [Parabacteroides sp. PH5-39]MDH6316037.1 AcrR family transcriptional regulator [Parabacteroides sp. PF5-13]MDH6319694.1 AcrR family transcriptional regulator [Parabacteroides sp. PH5-13]MDH6323425.1 AcrR family transcriptional regulator [Parabacteroides sp. PH5-8]MDH6327066.1 AcrR family transcriptional regulator [Parabacteroides sp. PH5-41]